MMKDLRLKLVWLCCLALLACRQAVDGPRPMVTATAASVATVTARPSAVFTPTAAAIPLTPPPTQLPTSMPAATPAPWRLAAEAAVPSEIVAAAYQLAAAQPARFTWIDSSGQADVWLTVGSGTPVATWVYAVVAPFPTLADTVTTADLMFAWQEGRSPLGALFLDEATAVTLATSWGEPDVVTHTAVIDLPAQLWAARPAWSILPFHELTPTLKVLAVEGVSPLAADFEPEHYPLAIAIGVEGEAAAVAEFLAHWPDHLTNRDPSRLTRVAMTGPSGLSRAVADRMEKHGVTHPGEQVASLLRAADFAHLSNEIPFAPDCPPSEQEPHGDVQFCARDAYLELMTYVGTDINEMTGNHVNDWGERNLQHTFDLYEASGIRTFGGGRDLAAAQQPLLLEHNNNHLAFVGCNPVGPPYAWAREGYAGALPCDDYTFIQDQIRALAQAGYLVIATLQYYEHYQYTPTGRQRADFRALAEAGATAVSGSQGHHAQGFDFHAGAFIHYGLGNLFFDQMQYLGTRQSFIDSYLIYENGLLSIEVWTGLIEDYCCPRPMTAVERAALLEALFQASGW